MIGQYKKKYKFITWLFTIGRNLFYDYCRQKKCFYLDENLQKSTDYERYMCMEREYEEKLDLKRALKNLDEDVQKIVEMRYVFGFKVRDIADIMALPEGTVKSKLFYAREKIKNFLKGSE
jgi:RNA polymerase sigma-70 factor (ECF subfamily)